MSNYFIQSAKPFLSHFYLIMGMVSILIILLTLMLACQPKPNLSGFDLAKGEQIYNNVCIACHVDGRFGAPKVGNQKDWSPRITKGMEVLFQSALQGLNSMPPRGGNPKLSDEEVKTAVAFMVSKSW
jgi:cytochrome c5